MTTWSSFLRAWIESNRNHNSQRSYSTYGRQYSAFAHANQLPPESDITLAACMYDAYKRGLSRSTICNSIPTAASNMFRYDTDNSPSVSPLVREMKKTITRLTPPSTAKLPVTPDMLKRLAFLVKPTYKSIRDFYIVLLMFLGFMRESEAAALSYSDVWIERVDDRDVLFVYVEKMKNDQDRIGHTIVISEAHGSPINPAAWHKLYTSARGGGHANAPFFNTAIGARKGLAPTTPNHIIKRLLRSINIDPDPYGSHSLRRGGVTAAVAKGIEMRLVARHGNWRSNAVYTYVSDSISQRLSVSQALLL